MGKNTLCTLRRGIDVFTFLDAELAEKELQASRGQYTVSAGKKGNTDATESFADVTAHVHSDTVLTRAQQSANSALNKCVKLFPTLTCPATTNFATTIRTPPVRALLDGKNLRGTPLAKVVGHMSDAADAGRHLSMTILEEMDELLEQVFADAVASTSQRPEQLHQDKGERHACHYWRGQWETYSWSGNWVSLDKQHHRANQHLANDAKPWTTYNDPWAHAKGDVEVPSMHKPSWIPVDAWSNYCRDGLTLASDHGHFASDMGPSFKCL